MRTYEAKIRLSLKLDDKEISLYPEDFQDYFTDLGNPTEQELKEYFREQLNYLAGSNTGSERLANANFDLVITNEKDIGTTGGEGS